MRRVKEPWGTLKPMWNKIADGTITNYTLHTITIDTPQRKDTVIRKSDIAIAKETIPEKPRLMEFVACKTVGEYKRNRETIKKFYLDEKKQKKRSRQRRKQKDSKRNLNRAEVNKDNQKLEPGHPRKISQHWSNAQNKERGRREAQKGSHNNRPNAQAHHNLT